MPREVIDGSSAEPFTWGLTEMRSAALSVSQPSGNIPAIKVKNPPHRKRTTMYTDELRRAALNLDPEIARWMIRALESDWFRVEPGAYEHGGRGGTVCPIVAAATMAGTWRNGQLLPGNPVWGAPDRPAKEVEEFAAYFDLCAEDSGTASAIRTVCGALVPVSGCRKLAA